MKLHHLFGKSMDGFIYYVACAGMSTVVLLTVLTAGDALLRYLFNSPITGAHELCEFILSVMAFFGMAYTAVEKGHIAVDIAFSYLPQRIRPFVDVFIAVLSLLIFGLITWRTALYGLQVQQRGVVSPTLNIPVFPFVLVTSFGIGLLTLVLLRDLVASLGALRRKG